MATAEATARIAWKAFQEFVPEVSAGMAQINSALRKSGIEAELRELLKIRCSQINGCAFCIQFHLNDARKLSVAQEKIDLLPAFREAGVFSPREVTALAWAERVTLLATEHIDDQAYEAVAGHFSERELALLTTAIAQINFWNRIAAPFRFTPPIPAHSS